MALAPGAAASAFAAIVAPSTQSAPSRGVGSASLPPAIQNTPRV